MQARKLRQARLFTDDAPKVRCVLDEHVLYRRIGSPEIIRAQLEYLVNEASSVASIQIIPRRPIVIAEEHSLSWRSMEAR
jgi:hypothetical protein